MNLPSHRIPSKLNLPSIDSKTFLKISIIITGLILLFSPLLEASWDVWSKTIVHLLTVLAVCVILLSHRKLDYSSSSGKTQVHLFSTYQYRSLNFTFSWHFIFLLSLFIWLYIVTLFAQIRFNAELELHNWVNYILIFLLINSFITNNLPVVKILNYAVISTFIMVIVAFYQFFILKQIPHATMVNPNIFAGYLVMVIPVMCYLAGNIKQQPPDKRMSLRSPLLSLRAIAKQSHIYYALIILSVFCLLLARSSGAIFGLIAAVFIQRYRFRGFILILLVGLILLIVKFNDPELINRYFWWKSTLNMVSDYPVTGTGLGNFEMIYPKYRITGLSSVFAHNYYLQFFSETGIIGILLFLTTIIVFLLRVRNPYIKTGIMACLIQNVFDYNLYLPANGLLFWTILAIGSSANSDVQDCRARLSQRDPDITSEFYGTWQPRKFSYTVSHNKHNVLVMLIYISMALYTYSITKVYFATEHFVKGKNLIEQENIQLAEKEFKKAIRYKPDFYLAYDNLANMYVKRYSRNRYKSDLIESIIELEKAIKYNPCNAQYHFQLASLHLFLNDRQQVIFHISKAIENDPSHVKFYSNWLRYNL